MMAVLQAGDANQDFYVDQADLIQAFKAGKYLTDQPASWSDGDWNGAPGGSEGQPPSGNGRFNLDDISAINLNLYRKEAYDPMAGEREESLETLQVGNVGQISLQYNRLLKRLTLDTRGRRLSTLHVSSASGLFADRTASPADSLGSLFEVNTSHDVFLINGSQGFNELSVQLKERYSFEEVLADLRVDGSWRDAPNTTVEYDPATGSLSIAASNTTLSVLELISSGGLFRPENIDSQLLNGLFDVRTPQKVFKLLPDGFASAAAPLVYDRVLPAGLTLAQLQTDLRIAGALLPSGSMATELVIKGEPASDTPLALGMAGVYCTCSAGSGTITGRVFRDTNGNNQWDAGELPLTGWEVQLNALPRAINVETVRSSMDINQNGTVEPSELGAFQFAQLPPGDYEVAILPDRGYEFVSLPTNLIRVTLAAGQQTDLAFPASLIPGPLRPGDANQDLYIDEADLIQVFKTGKFQKNVPATWSEGDWNGGSGGRVGSPTTGNGRFDARDLDLFVRSLYRNGKYNEAAGAAKNELQPLSTNGTGEVTLEYDRLLKKITVNPRNGSLSTFHLKSTRSIFAGVEGLNFDPFTQFDVTTPNEIFAIRTWIGMGPFTINTTDRLTTEELLASLRVDGSKFQGGFGAVDLVCHCGAGDGSIRGTIFEDLDRSGSRGSNEKGLSGWTVQLKSVDRGIVLDTIVSGQDLNGDGVVDTSEEGSYLFTKLPAGAYTITATPLRGHQLPGPTNVIQVNLGADQQLTDQSFAAWKIPPGIIRGQLFFDRNGNQVRDAGETGINGRSVSVGFQSVQTASRDWNQDGAIDPETEQGWYEMELVPDGYFVRTPVPAGWNASTPTFQFVSLQADQTHEIHFGMRETLRGDLNLDFVVDASDIDTLFRSVRDADFRKRSHDLTGDQRVTQADVEVLVGNILGTSLGDANLDRRFDSQDFVIVMQAGEYEDSVRGNSTWAEGDWNGDGDFSAYDLIEALQTGRYQSAPPAIAAANSVARFATPTHTHAVDQALAVDALIHAARLRRVETDSEGEDDEGDGSVNDLFWF